MTVGGGKGKRVERAVAARDHDVGHALEVDVDFRRYAAFFLQDESVRALANMQLPGLPVEAVTQSLGGEETSRLTLIGVRRQAVDDSEFSVE